MASIQENPAPTAPDTSAGAPEKPDRGEKPAPPPDPKPAPIFRDWAMI